MTSTKTLEETLPLVAPRPAITFVKPSLRTKYSVYTTTALENSQRQRLLADLHSDEDSNQSCRLAPDEFQNTLLRDVYNYHIRARDEDDSVHPFYFIVADQPDWDIAGVLMVYLKVLTDRKVPSNVIGVSRGSVRGPLGAESMGMNLDVGNIEWTDVKQTEHNQWNGEDPFTNQRYFANGPRTAITPTYHSTIYAWYSLVRKVVPIHSMLEPDWPYLNDDESRFALRGSFAREPTPWIQIRRHHPWACLTSDRIDREFFLVAEKEDADSEKGLGIYWANWDGDLSGFSCDPETNNVIGDRDRLMAIEPEIEFVKHVRARRALQELDALAAQRE